MAKVFRSKIAAAIHEAAEDLYAVGAISKITMREYDSSCLKPLVELPPTAIRALREDEDVSQAVFARYLNVTAGLVSQWERGEKKPSGPSLKLLSLVKDKGLEALL